MEAIIQKALRLLLDQFGAQYDAVGVIEENGHYRANIETMETGLLIGRRGNVLMSLETILKHIIWEQTGEKVFFSLDVDNYRKDRDDKVIATVNEKIDFMKDRGLPELKFQPMNPYTRRMVHLYIASKYPELSTDSVGEGRNRAIKVFYK